MDELSTAWERKLQTIVSDPELHCRWLETLSQLELAGARKIVKYQPPVHCPLDVLQHSAEEHRHAFFFKNQIRKIPGDTSLKRRYLGGDRSRRLLHRLDIEICRILKAAGYQGRKLKDAAYLLTTLCIELRADWLYPLYEKVLKASGSAVSLRSIIREEEAHLAFVEKKADQEKLSRFFIPAREAESRLFSEFSRNLERELSAL